MGQTKELDFPDRLAVVALIAEEDSGLGRTKLMKYMYLLQTGKGVPFGYRFRFYLYGPYDPSVLSDLWLAEDWGAVTEKATELPDGNIRYEIRQAGRAGDLIKWRMPYLKPYYDTVIKTVQNLKNYEAADFEIMGTIVWLDRTAYRKGEKVTAEGLANDALEIKSRLKYRRDAAIDLVRKLSKEGMLRALDA
ncbi:MAG: hypothetical protein N3A38_08675 [Planctomycetota bacterium]|nr:hypothetical protein [Planctomycetota bacterium]